MVGTCLAFLGGGLGGEDVQVSEEDIIPPHMVGLRLGLLIYLVRSI